MISDSNPRLYVPFGFQGGIYDSGTKLVHFNDRRMISSPAIPTFNKNSFKEREWSEDFTFYEGAEYDPAIGQWTSSSIADLKNAEINPFYPYQVIDPINLYPLYKSLTKTSSWLEALGFRMNNVAVNFQMSNQLKVKEN